MADSICPVLKTTFDCPGLQANGKMPLLNLQVWVQRVKKQTGEGEEGRTEWEVLWEYYRKPCSTRTLMLARSAMSDRTKRSALTQEAIQILRSCSMSLPWTRKAQLLSDFSLRMKISGYSERYRETIFKSAISAWRKQVEMDRTGEHPLYRKRDWKKDERKKQKEYKRAGWYRKLGGQTNDFAIFCPASPGSRLATKWKQELEEIRKSSGDLIRGYVAEQSGTPISAILFDNQLGEADRCENQDCNPCLTGNTKRLSCRRVTRGGMVYTCTCLTCQQAVIPKKSVYHGRSQRTMYTRQSEHCQGFESKQPNNALYKHAVLHHPSEKPKYEFQPEKFFPDSMSAQIFEGVRIGNSESDEGCLMNSRSEYEQNHVARVVIVRGLAE